MGHGGAARQFRFMHQRLVARCLDSLELVRGDEDIVDYLDPASAEGRWWTNPVA